MSDQLQILATIPSRKLSIDQVEGFSSQYKKKIVKRIKSIRSSKLIESQQTAIDILKIISFLTNNLDTIEAHIAIK